MTDLNFIDRSQQLAMTLARKNRVPDAGVYSDGDKHKGIVDRVVAGKTVDSRILMDGFQGYRKLAVPVCRETLKSRPISERTTWFSFASF
jgi:hypothetical protein